MTGNRKALIGLAAVVSCGVFASGAAATKTRVEKAETKSSFTLDASNKYDLEVTASRLAGEPKATVTVSAVRQRPKVEELRVDYSTRTRLHPDGGFDVKLPGLGRIDVSFEGEKPRKVRVEGNRACTGYTESARQGDFRGTIAFRGEGGFTEARARSARGYTVRTSRRQCQEPDFPEAPELPAGFRNAVLFAEGQSGGDTTTFEAAGPPAAEPEVSSGGIPTVAFQATYSTERRGMQILGSVSLDTGSAFFHVLGPAKQLTEATVTPPAPFSGTATYKAESPTGAGWTGDLSVDFPGLGPKPLVLPGMASRLCEGPVCTGAPLPTG